MTENWYELWADEGPSVPCVLMVRPSSKGFEVLDLAAGDKKVFESQHYQEVVYWLREDEYELVARKQIDND